ncbi:MAG TPA: PD-(D/E)XK nuclease family protein [Streptosporangiaceae bacterium]|nr:PD-(D/E)XK nuclease family protein [Streptosporangiaceae bacterium]
MAALSVFWLTLPEMDESMTALITAPAEAEVAAAAEVAAEAGQVAEVSDERVVWSLSPSRAADFMTCPLLYRFRVIDRLPEAPSAVAARGTLVHAVLERLFDAPAKDRSPAAAEQLLEPEWDKLVAAEPELECLFADEAERALWLAQAREMLDRYFTLEDPTRLEPAHRELKVQVVLSSGLRLRGYIDRLDVSATGDVRIVDYKTGTAPREEFEARALFQMKFYALVLWRTSGTVPRLLQLIYLGNGEIMRYAPDEADLLATERKIEALWKAIERARLAADWRPRRSRLCDWCAHQQFCPEFGGTPPPLPVADAPVSAAAAVTAGAPAGSGVPAAVAGSARSSAQDEVDHLPHMADVADLT